MINLSTMEEITLLKYLKEHGIIGHENNKLLSSVIKKLEFDLRDD